MSEKLKDQHFRLAVNIYCLYNNFKKTYSIPFFAVSDDDAKYQVARLFIDNDNFDANDFQLRCLGSMDQSLYENPITVNVRDICHCQMLSLKSLVGGV